MPSKVSVRDQLRTGAVGLSSRRVRTLLSALGVAIGVATVVSVLGISRSSQADLLDQLDALGTNLLQVQAGGGLGFGGSTDLPDTAATQVRNIDPVDDVATVTTLTGPVLRNALSDPVVTGGLTVRAADTSLLDTLAGSMADGRFLDEAIDDYPVVVLGAVAAERLGIEEVDGRTAVYLDGRNWQVVGILDELPLAPDIDRSVLLGYDAAATYLADDLAPSGLYVRADPDTVDAVADVLPAQANPAEPENVEVSRPSDALAAKAAAGDAFTSLFLGLGAVALLVGAVGTANVMVMSVLERRGEIGLRRALGATKGHVRTQFIVESLMLSLAGGLVGIGIGAVVTLGYAVVKDASYVVPLSAVGYGLGAAVVIGVLAGVYPATRAARLSPTEALRA
ncbi:MAG: ABC transporter permease [Actinomycetota bacterium]|nr:ABC transporter permease [Actinomycetota bacterium]